MTCGILAGKKNLMEGSSRGRVVKASDQKSDSLWERRFESCRLRIFGHLSLTFIYLLKHSYIYRQCALQHTVNKHRWFSGRMAACHAVGPGSIPGRCKATFSCIHSNRSQQEFPLRRPFWKCNFPMNHNVCLSVGLSVCLSVCPNKMSKFVKTS